MCRDNILDPRQPFWHWTMIQISTEIEEWSSSNSYKVSYQTRMFGSGQANRQPWVNVADGVNSYLHNKFNSCPHKLYICAMIIHSILPSQCVTMVWQQKITRPQAQLPYLRDILLVSMCLLSVGYIKILLKFTHKLDMLSYMRNHISFCIILSYCLFMIASLTWRKWENICYYILI